MSFRRIMVALVLIGQPLSATAQPLEDSLNKLIPVHARAIFNSMVVNPEFMPKGDYQLFFGPVAKALAERCQLPEDAALRQAFGAFSQQADEKSATATPYSHKNFYLAGIEFGKTIDCTTPEAQRIASVLATRFGPKSPTADVASADSSIAGAADYMTILQSSQIVERHESGSYNAPEGLPPIDTRGFQRGDFIDPIYNGRWSWVANTGAQNVGYFVWTLKAIHDSCPAYGIADRYWELAPYFFLEGEHRLLTGWKRDSSTPAQTSNLIALALQQLNLVPSPEAYHDVGLLRAVHACDSPMLAHYVENLFKFARTARFRPFVRSQMPAPDTPQGKRLIRIFENCSDRAENGIADQWCGCYVRALFDTQVPDPVLASLENNPFADGRTYMHAVAMSVANRPRQQGDHYECANTAGGRDLSAYRLNGREKVTACLVSQKPCRYRTARAEFTISGESCSPTLTSRTFGGQEISCDAGKVALVPRSDGPKKYKGDGYNRIDYEEKVPAGFAPPVPELSIAELPVAINMRRQDQPGSLYRVIIEKPHLYFFHGMDRFRSGSPEWKAAYADIAAVRKDGAVIRCEYIGAVMDGQVTAISASNLYWYKAAPASLASIDLSNLGGFPHPLLVVRPARNDCPAQAE